MAQESASDLERRLALAQRELSEASERQAATDEVLGIIASSPGELEPVFQAILANATRICEAKFATLFKFDGEGLMFEAGLGMPQRLADYLKQRQKFKPLAGSTMERLVETLRWFMCTMLRKQMAWPAPRQCLAELAHTSACRCSKRTSWLEPL
jgi:hypothetical protein